ncbi:MAG: hypothetical protein QUV07_05705 [Cyanobium sp. CZS 25K]|nr:hypothetical protein [Cyanobium sp. CZS25K]
MDISSQSYAPRSGDDALFRGGVRIDQVKYAGASEQGGTRLLLIGSLPTPCHELRMEIAGKTVADGLLQLQVWSVVDPAVMCAQVLQPFSVEVPVPVEQGKSVIAIAINGTHFELETY